MGIRLPRWSEVERFFKDPEIVTAECLFLFLTIANILVMYRLFLDVIPFPIFVTWWQLAQGLFMAWCFGALGEEFPKLQYFPAVTYDRRLLKELLIPTLVYLVMLVLGNVVLTRSPSVAAFPIVVTFTVILHHVTRFVGCGEEYMKTRWISMAVMFSGFVIGCTDPLTVGAVVLPWAVLYAISSAVFRACYLQKVMHIVEGKGNTLHNHQHLMGVLLLPLLWLPFGDWKIFTVLPYNFDRLHTWQTWGCLLTVGALPFLKNIVSNRLIRRTGQGPWRALEVTSILLVFLVGVTCFSVTPGWQGWLAIMVIVVGRTIGMYDVLINAANAEEHFQDRRGGGEPSEELNAPLNSADQPDIVV